MWDVLVRLYIKVDKTWLLTWDSVLNRQSTYLNMLYNTVATGEKISIIMV